MIATESKDVLRPTDDGARGQARDLVRRARFGMLATLGTDGHPNASLVSLATDVDGTPLALVSALAAHTGNLAADSRASLLLAPGGKGDPLAHARLTVKVRARPVAREGEEAVRVRRRFLARQPKAQLYVDFPDFSFFALEVLGASLNGGFGRAYELAPEDILSAPGSVAALTSAEADAVEHMNADHAEAVSLYAVALLGAREGHWRLTGLDPDGLDLMLGDEVLRLPFQPSLTDAEALRPALVQLARKARAVA